ncbi:MAG: hypothetical protein DRJ03_18075 [Chloroflexi bacterium]|nr:MAG: hypothetical protein B6I35_08120 [Anaerolineaceae bacterium 4572_32.2]RLC76679.1 MAG: hypothetical protein DRI81_09830 [Chloroflexota bacterium]RLC83067.1 MAG: hypothetical protein DRJ03_18075 [Chloroflexota bacterium]
MSPTPIPPTLVPSPTPTPTPTPTATPIPPLELTIRWPEQVSALQPVDIQVELAPPPGVSVTATVRAAVLDPQGLPYRGLCDLTPREGNLYAAEEPLELPFEPPAGEWKLVVYVQSTLAVEGEREVIFQPASIPLRDLTDVLPAGADIHAPQRFVEAVSQGDRVAGGRVWRYGGGEVALWWAPGPVEPLLLNNALVMLETTHDPGAAPQVMSVEETEWQGQTAFLFREEWTGANGGPAEALVAQGPDHHLYVLRVRATGGETIPALLRQVWETFTFVE